MTDIALILQANLRILALFASIHQEDISKHLNLVINNERSHFAKKFDEGDYLKNNDFPMIFVVPKRFQFLGIFATATGISHQDFEQLLLISLLLYTHLSK